ncbi:MAG TPA: hypothetical protein VE127_01340 [Solirubrobacteraceae bacterium]|nr:hypothetical protein [Solirubrobacteraceae bacterium]
MLRRFIMLAAVAVLCAAGASAALAARPSPSNPAGKMLGVVPSRHQAGHNKAGGANLTYHNGPVMRTNTVYAIYWVPPEYTVDSRYESLINQFFGDVAADNGRTSNVYYSDTQYYDTTGNIAYASTFGGSSVDTDPLPASGCSDSYTSVCLTDSQLQAEISKVIKNQGWKPNSSTEFFMFTAKGIGSCDGSSCSFSQYCAYHSWIGSGSNATIYANMPYADTVPSACDAGQHPNNDDADATINVTSHEHNESITDEQGSAWYDRRGYEDGDKCAWNFGTALGLTAYGQYNQVINGDDYYLQQEWSNHSSGCVLQGL